MILPGKGDDRILALVAENCHALEVLLHFLHIQLFENTPEIQLDLFLFLQELDVSNSFITDKGLLSICGVTVTEVSIVITEQLASLQMLLNESHCPSRWTLGREVLKRSKRRRRRRGER